MAATGSSGWARFTSTVLQHRGVQLAAGLWIGAHLVVLALVGNQLPFDRPALAALPFAVQMAAPTLGLIEIFFLMAIVWWLTRNRTLPDIAARVPDGQTARRETALVLGYAAIGQVGGWLIGPALGYRPFSFHIAGTLVGCSTPPSPGEVWLWMSYNFVVFAIIPFLWFRRRYTNEQLSLHSSNRANDLLVIIVVLVIESLFEVSQLGGILELTSRQLLVAVPLAFAAFFLGTVLPTMVLIYAILIPRYLRLTGSVTTTVLLGGVTYAAMHIVEGWSLFTTPANTLLSLIFVLLTYFGPGMIKTVLTLRTGNAWVHAFAYHAVAPHVVADAPLMAKAFAIRP